MSVLPNTPPPESADPGPNGDAVGQAREFGVPRRFGVGTLLLITAMYAVLFAVLRAMQVPPVGFVLIGVFFGAVGLGQMLLFKGQRPRRASVLVGACAYPCLFLAAELYHSGQPGLDLLFAMALAGMISGAVYGYLAGLLIAGVFLVNEKLKQICQNLRGRGDDATP